MPQTASMFTDLIAEHVITRGVQKLVWRSRFMALV